jgi:serine protease AprX
MKEITLAALISMAAVASALSAASQSVSDINAKVAQLDMDTATLDDVIQIFGEPKEYLWGEKKFTKASLPSTYLAAYPNGFRVLISGGEVRELRFESPAAGYLYRDKLTVGSSLDEVFELVGEPAETVEGQALPGMAKDSVLYKDINGRKGYCYHSRRDEGVRFFFGNYKVSGLYLTRSGPVGGKGRSFGSVQPITSVKAFDDVRWKDMSKLDLSARKGLVATLTFNQKTVWPEPAKMPPDDEPERVLKEAMNPGLGVRKLHQQGITGKGVNVAIIDQPLYLDHPEFAGKIVAYHDTGCGTESSMHGPAVASLLVGTNCGTAPDARLYYAAVPSWKRDTAYEAKALDWIIEQDNNLPALQKIRVVSVSAAPSGPGAPRDKNQHTWDQACARAEAAGILVLDCTSHHGFIGSCWYALRVPESVTRCTPGFPGRPGYRARPGTILVPSSPRTTAEQYDKGDFSYQYCGRGGLSWAIPYCAGVLALGWQVNPDLGSTQMRDLLFESAYTNKSGAKIIYPRKFIQLVKTAKAAPWDQAPRTTRRR